MMLQDSHRELIHKAHTLQGQGKYEEARDLFLRVAKSLSRLSPATFEKRDDLTEIFIQSVIFSNSLSRFIGDYDATNEVIDRISHLKPDLAQAWERLKAETLADAGRIDEAMALVKQLAQRHPDEAQYVLSLASEAHWNRRFEEALDLLPEPIEMPYENQEQQELAAHIWFLRFRILAEMGCLQEAEQAWLNAGQIAGREAVPVRELVELFLRHGDTSKALAYAEQETDQACRGFLRGLVAELTGRHDWARDEWWRVAREPYNPEEPSVDEWLECMLRVDDDPDKAISAINAARDTHWFSARLLIYHVVALAKMGDRERTQELLDHQTALRRQNRIGRQHMVKESDRWLIDQAVQDEGFRQLLHVGFFGAADQDVIGGTPAATGSADPDDGALEE